MTPQGIATVARQEFRLRIRAGRWKWLLVAWVALLVLFTLLATAAAGSIDDLDDDGTVIYGALVLFVLGLALLVVPSLSAQSVNGDRERGTLASLQVTRLTPGDITLGKFAAAWGTALAFLGLSLPMVLFTITRGGVSFGRIVVVTALLALLLGTVCAVSLWLSAALTRTTTSGVLSYLAVGALTIGTLITFGLGTLAVQEEYDESYVSCQTQASSEQYYGDQGSQGPLPDGCTTETYETSRTRTDRVWWLLAPNPFVIVADAAPRLGPVPDELDERAERNAEQARDVDVLGQLGTEIRDLREGPDDGVGPGFDYAALREVAAAPDEPGPVWPWGLAFDVLLAGLALWLTSRRLRTPSRVLPKGQRVA